MARVPAFQDYLHQVETAANCDDLWAILGDYRRSHHLPAFSYIHFEPIGAPPLDKPMAKAEGLAEEWFQTFITTHHSYVDMVTAAAMTAAKPFRWSEILAEATRSGSKSPEQDRFFKDLAAAKVGGKIGDAIGFPVFGPLGRRAICSIALHDGQYTLVPEDVPELMHEVQWLFQSAHIKHCELLLTHTPSSIDLSPREAEILNWVARGKSNSVIANILDVSAHTIDTHMRRIYNKLNVSDRVAAAIYGVGAGIIR